MCMYSRPSRRWLFAALTFSATRNHASHLYDVNECVYRPPSIDVTSITTT